MRKTVLVGQMVAVASLAFADMRVEPAMALGEGNLGGAQMAAATPVPDGDGGVVKLTGSEAAIEPAAGDEGDALPPSALDERVEQIKAHSSKPEAHARREALVNDVATAGRPADMGGLKVLSEKDVAGYKAALRQARAGQAPNAAGVTDKLLWGHVRGVYLLNKPGASFNELNGWLRDYRDHALAKEIYEKADAKREMPRQVCETKLVTVKGKPAKAKKGKDAKQKAVASRKVKQRVCHTVGKWGPAPLVPLMVELRENARIEREAARDAELAKVSAEGRRVLGQSWRLRGQGNYPEALRTLLAPRARVDAGTDRWQGELVKIADAYHGKRDWANVLKAAVPASEERGSSRNEALWLGGYAAYRLGHVEQAARMWEQLVREEPLRGKHYTRAAWWGARALTELKQTDKARQLLQLGARDNVSFYGQLCAAKLGTPVQLAWQAPPVADGELGALKKVPAARRGLALAQLGEVTLAQREFKLADPDMPYQGTRALAGIAVRLNLPATALQAGKQLAERGEVVAAALYPLPDQWSPTGGWNFDKALVYGIMRQESAFQPQIGSRVGAQGLMQIMPATGNYVGRMTGMGNMSRSDLHDPATNLALAQAYLKYLGGKLDGNMLLTVAAYNGGIGNVQRWLDRGVTPGHDPVLWLESIPFDETRDYVEKVFANYWLYQQRMGQKTWSLAALADGFWPLRWASKPTANNEG